VKLIFPPNNYKAKQVKLNKKISGILFAVITKKLWLLRPQEKIQWLKRKPKKKIGR
jgi:hypothetical protein